MNEVRKHKHEILFRDAPDVEAIPSKELSSPEHIDAEALRTMIRASLQDLPGIYREPLTLAFLEERSYQEISDILRLPVGTVGTRITRGKTLLKQTYLRHATHKESYGQE
jgi:RNA polymerase sigma factor (sigma-70 family)